MDKGCWGVPADRYGARIPAETEKYASMDEYTISGCTPTVPVDMCSHCPLDIDNIEFNEKGDPNNTSGCDPGDFINCGRMFKIDSLECKGSLYKWAEDTPCDNVLPEQLKVYYEDNPGDTYNYEKDKAGQILDRYVYTVCEQCCDCIPCTNETDTLNPIIEDDQLPIDVYRHNCPLHWVFDVCGIYADIEYRGPLPFTYYDPTSELLVGEAIEIAEGLECALKEADGSCSPVDVCQLTR